MSYIRYTVTWLMTDTGCWIRSQRLAVLPARGNRSPHQKTGHSPFALREGRVLFDKLLASDDYEEDFTRFRVVA